jgi:hypothetical protein
MLEKMVRRAHSGIWPGGGFILLLAILLSIAACAPPGNKTAELSKEVQDLQKEVKAMQAKLDKLLAGQAALQKSMQKPMMPPQAPFTPPPMPQQFQPVQPPAAAQPLTVSELIAGKEKYLGSRVTVRGPAGPVMVNHKSIFLKSPQGMVEVLFGGLPDQKVAERLISIPVEQPLTVTGLVSLPVKAGAAKLQITAEDVQF